jgi:hypothetical protein
MSVTKAVAKYRTQFLGREIPSFWGVAGTWLVV